MDDAQQLTLGVFRLEFGNLCQDPFRGIGRMFMISIIALRVDVIVIGERWEFRERRNESWRARQNEVSKGVRRTYLQPWSP